MMAVRLHAIIWSTPTPITNDPLCTSSPFCIAQLYNPKIKGILASWITLEKNQITYAVYTDENQWSAPSIIDPSATSRIPPALCYNPINEEVLLAWTDLTTGFPMYSRQIASGWSSPQPISNSEQSSVLLSLSTVRDTIVATWVNHNNSSAPLYAIYHDGKWGATEEITNDPDFQVQGSVMSCYDPICKTLLAVWGNLHTTYPQYAIYNGKSWSSPNTITSNSEVIHNCALVYDNQRQRTIITWGDSHNQSSPTYAIYQNGFWRVFQRPIPNSLEIQLNTLLAGNPTANEIWASWGTALESIPTYTKLVSTRWAAPKAISLDSRVLGDVTLSIYPPSNKILAIWISDDGDSVPTYSIGVEK